MTEEARKLADRIEAYLEDAPIDGGHSDVAGSNSWELLEEAMHEIRSQPGTLAREEVARIIRCTVYRDGNTACGFNGELDAADAILALTPSHEAGPITTEQLDKLQFGKVVHDRPHEAGTQTMAAFASIERAIYRLREWVNLEGPYTEIIKEVAIIERRIEQLKTAPEAGTQAVLDSYADENQRLSDEIEALKVSAGTQEPIAWQGRDKVHGGAWVTPCKPGSNPDFEYRPLYAAPASQDATREITDAELSDWARKWHWADCEREGFDHTIYPRDLRMLKAFIASPARADQEPK